MTLHAVEPDAYRAVMGRFATGVTVVTVTGPAGPVGMTANAVCSLSLDPLLLLVCFDNRSQTLPIVRAAGRFGVNVLRESQADIALLFASRLPEREQFAGVRHTMQEGIPVLSDALAWVACELTELMPGGDHTIGVGAVRRVEAAEGEPLIWYRGMFGGFTAP